MRTIHDVLKEVCEHMTCERQFKLPPAAPFFLIALFRKGPRCLSYPLSEHFPHRDAVTSDLVGDGGRKVVKLQIMIVG